MVVLNELPFELINAIFKFCDKLWLVRLRNLVVDDNLSLLVECIDSALFERVIITSCFKGTKIDFKSFPFCLANPIISTQSWFPPSYIQEIMLDQEVTICSAELLGNGNAMEIVQKYAKEIYYLRGCFDFPFEGEQSFIDFINSAKKLKHLGNSKVLTGITTQLTQMEIPPNFAYEMLPDTFKKLESLAITGFSIDTELGEYLNHSSHDLSKLKKLKLINCISFFNGSEWNLCNLQELRISRKEADSILISNMKSSCFPLLRTLALGNCFLANEIGITDLSSLVLFDMDISKNPVSFNSVRNLNELSLRNVELIEIPILSHLQKLKSLEITKNKELVEVNNNFLDLLNLTSINLSNNNIHSSLVDFSIFTKLKELNLSENKLTSLDYVDDIPCLIRLNVRHNEITGLGRLLYPYLRELDISWNQLKSLKELNNLPSLVDLKFNSNKITDIPNFTFPNLRALRVGKNPLRDLESLTNLTNLKILHLGNIVIESFQNLNFIKDLGNLRGLYLFLNGIKEIESFQIRGLRASFKIEMYNLKLKESFDLLFGDNEKLTIYCRLGAGSKFCLFSGLLIEPHNEMYYWKYK